MSCLSTTSLLITVRDIFVEARTEFDEEEVIKQKGSKNEHIMN